MLVLGIESKRVFGSNSPHFGFFVLKISQSKRRGIFTLSAIILNPSEKTRREYFIRRENYLT